MSEFEVITKDDRKQVVEKRTVQTLTLEQVDDELARIEAVVQQWQQRYQALLAVRSSLAVPKPPTPKGK